MPCEQKGKEDQTLITLQ